MTTEAEIWLTLDSIEGQLRALRQLVGRQRHVPLSEPQKVLYAACNAVGYAPGDLLNREKHAHKVHARNAAFVVVWQLTNLRQSALCELFKRDHTNFTTIIAAVRNRMETERGYAAVLDRITEQVRAELGLTIERTL